MRKKMTFVDRLGLGATKSRAQETLEQAGKIGLIALIRSGSPLTVADRTFIAGEIERLYKRVGKKRAADKKYEATKRPPKGTSSKRLLDDASDNLFLANEFFEGLKLRGLSAKDARSEAAERFGYKNGESLRSALVEWRKRIRGNPLPRSRKA